jgi:pimeloyl-ACP methyl ester carboxylesterase
MEHFTDTPRLLQLKDGRSLAWGCYGDPLGRPLYVFHGFPGCRLQAALLREQAAAAGVLLVAPERPGFGRSTPQPRRSILGWAADVAQLADHLGHARFGIAGISCGGPYALACAHQMPSRVSWVGLVAGIGPMDAPAIRKGQMPLLRAMFALARINPWLASPVLALDALMFRRDAGRALRQLAGMMVEPDRRLLAEQPRVAAEFAASLAEAYHQGLAGVLREAQLIGSPRGYALEDIRVPVRVYQSGIDRNVPPAMGEYMAQRLPQGQLRLYPGEGHLSILVNRGADFLADFMQQE